MPEIRQDPPFCVQIELTEGCNLRCPFCGLNGIRGKENDFHFMTVETAERVAQSMAEALWNSRVEFAMHGEPTMNPASLEIVATFRQHLPKAYMLMESNGGGLVADPRERISALYRAGLTTLALDEYQTIKLVPKIMERLALPYKDAALTFDNSSPPARLLVYPACGPDGNPHHRHPLSDRRLVWIKPIDLSNSGTHATLNNHGGAGAPKNQKAAGKRCAKPFREMSVRWDGSVAVCCNDWRGEMPIGNISTMSVDEIWHHPRFTAARRKLYAGQRDFGACNGCDALSYRPGLLPNYMGKGEMDPPGAEETRIIAEALAEGPLTKPVLRPWELTPA